MATGIIDSKKAVQFAIYKNGNGNKTLDPLRMQAIILKAVGRIILECINISDKDDGILFLVLKTIHPSCYYINGHCLQILNLRRDTISANFVGIPSKIFLPLKFKYVGTIRIVIFEDSRQPRVDRCCEVIVHDKVFNTVKQLLFH